MTIHKLCYMKWVFESNHYPCFRGRNFLSYWWTNMTLTTFLLQAVVSLLAITTFPIVLNVQRYALAGRILGVANVNNLSLYQRNRIILFVTAYCLYQVLCWSNYYSLQNFLCGLSLVILALMDQDATFMDMTTAVFLAVITVTPLLVQHGCHVVQCFSGMAGEQWFLKTSIPYENSKIVELQETWFGESSLFLSLLVCD